MLLREALKAGIDRLAAAQVGSPRLNAEVLLMFVLGKDRAYLYAHGDDALEAQSFARYEQCSGATSARNPVAIHHRPSGILGMDFIVCPLC